MADEQTNAEEIPAQPNIGGTGTGGGEMQLMMQQMMEQNRQQNEQSRQQNDQMMKQNELLMKMLDSRNSPPEQQTRFQSVRPERAPQFTGNNFENWLEMIGDWEALHKSVEPSQKAGLLLGGLSGEPLLLARAAVKSAGLELTDENAFKSVIEELTKHYGTNKAIKEFNEFQRLISISNTGDNLEAYIRQYTIRAEAAREQGLTLPDRLSIFMLLNGSGLGQSQLQQVLTTAEQMAVANTQSSELRMSDIQHTLRSMAQARNLRTSSSRRVRSAFVGVTDEVHAKDVEDEWYDISDEDWSEDVINDDPEYIAAVAQVRNNFRSKKGKGKGKGKGKAAKGGYPKTSPGTDGRPKGPHENKCKFTGKSTFDGEMKCWKLKENEKCPRDHPSQDIDDAREMLKSKGLIPTFNAWDASENFREMTKSFMEGRSARMIVDPGAKKSVCGEKWLELFERQLKKVSSNRVQGVALKKGEKRRVFQFGGGLKVSIGRKRLPMWIQTGEGTRTTHVVVDVVPGYLPLLFGYDAQKYHRIYANPVTDKMYECTSIDREIKNCCVDSSIGIMTMDLLNQTLSNHGKCVEDSTEGKSRPSMDTTLVATASTESQVDLSRVLSTDRLSEKPTETSNCVNPNVIIRAAIRSAVSDGTETKSVKVSAPTDSPSVKVRAPAGESTKVSVPVDPSIKVRAPIDAYINGLHGLQEVANVSLTSPEVTPGNRKGITLTEERMKHIHMLTKCTLSATALKKLLRRANVSNVKQCLEWNRSIVAACGCVRAEYANRHRLPRMKLEDLPFNCHLEVDLMDMCSNYFLVICCRGTRFVQAVLLKNKTAAAVRHAYLTRWVHVFGAPSRVISDNGSEFMSKTFLECTDLMVTMKENTPAYASDRHASVERVIRTLRESAERAITGMQHRPTLPELEEIVAICTNECNNDLQPCGTSAAERAMGRATSPFLSMLQREVPPADSDLRRIQERTREAWREVVNDKAFYLLATRQTGPQANITPPEIGELVYYRRPDPTNDSPQFRGPAEVVGLSHRTEQAYVVHGGLFARVAFEHVKRIGKAPLGRKTPDGAPNAMHEELDRRDGEPAHPPDPVGEIVPVPIVESRQAVLEPSASHGYGDEGGAPSSSAPPEPALPKPNPEVSGGDREIPVEELIDVDVSGGDSAAPSTPVRIEPVEMKVIVEPDDEISPGGPPPTDRFAEWCEEPPVKNEARDYLDWMADEPPSTVRDVPDRCVPTFDLEANEPVVDHPPAGYDDVPTAVPIPAHNLSLGDRISVLRQDPSRVRAVWESGRVVDIPEDEPNRVQIEWTAPTPELPENVDLSSETWKQLRASSRVRWEPKMVPRHRLSLVAPTPDAVSAEPNLLAVPNAETSGGVYALIAALESRLAEFKRTGGGMSMSASTPRTRSVLAAVVATPASISRFEPSLPERTVPTTLSHTHSELLRTQLSLSVSKRDLELIGVTLADCFPGTLHVLLQALLNRDTGMQLTDRSALAAFQELGRVYPLPDDAKVSGRSDPLGVSLETLLNESEKNRVNPRTSATVLVLCERGLAQQNGETVASGMRPEEVALAALQDTDVYRFSAADLTDQMRKDGLTKEMGQFEEYGVFAGEWVSELPSGASKIDSRVLENPKVKNGKLVCKSRLVGKGFQDPERFASRNDSPAATRTVIMIVLEIGLVFEWEWIKEDALCAFLNGDPLERTNLFMKAPDLLMKMGFVPAGRPYRRLAKAVYGLNEAPRRWFLKLTRILLENGLVQSLIDSCLFLVIREGKTRAAVVVYVDDLLMGGESKYLTWLDNLVKGALPIGTTERSKVADSLQVTMSYVGRDIVFRREHKDGPITEIEVNQTKYIDSQFSDEHINGFEVGKRSAQLPLKASEADWFRTSLGRCMWIVTTRPDIAYDVSEASSAMQAPTVGDAKRLQKVMRMLLLTSEKGICLPKLSPNDLLLVLYTDGSYANVGTRTQGGHVLCLCARSEFENGKVGSKRAALLTWLSSTIKRVCTSTFDSEILSLLRGTDEQLSAAYLISELFGSRLPSVWEHALANGFGSRAPLKPTVPMLALTDAESVVSSIYSSKTNIRNKRRRVDIASLREIGEDLEDSWRLEHVDTSKQVADGLTKRMDTSQLREVMQGRIQR